MPTLEVLREAAQRPRVKGAVDRLLKAATAHLRARKFPRKLQHNAGTYYGEHRPVLLVDAPAAWVKDELSFNFRRDATLGADAVALDWVTGVRVAEGGQLHIQLDRDISAHMATSSGVFGWAEAASAAAGVAAREIWQPFLEWDTTEARSDTNAADTLWAKTTRMLSRAVGVVAICDEQGLQRLLAISFAMLQAVAALASAAATCHEAVWRRLLQLWLDDLQQKALLGNFKLSMHRNSVLLSSPDSHRAQPSAARQYVLAERPQSGEKQGAREKSKKLARQFDDDPDTFVWCSVCHTHRHCLWACSAMPRDLQRRTKRGESTQTAADTLIKATRRKYEQKGPAFVEAFDKRSNRTRADLLRSLSA